MKDVRVQLASGVLEVCLCRTSKRNALTAEMYGTLADSLERASRDNGVHAVVFTAEGRDFCAGNDLQEFLGAYSLLGDSPWRRFIEALPRCSKPMVAAVHGNAVGIGLTMLLHFDLVYVEPSTRLSAPFGLLGVVPEAGSSMLLSKVIGPQRAKEAFLTGRSFSADEAVAMGLACAQVPEGQGRAAALNAAQAIAALPSMSAQAIRRLCAESGASLSESMNAECVAFMACLNTVETRSILERMASRSTRSGKTS